MQNTNINLPMDAAEIVQQMLSRKRLIASQSLDYGGQGQQQNGASTSGAPMLAPGVLGQSMAAAFFGEAGLTEQELALVSDAVQQVIAGHEASPAPSNLAAAVGKQVSIGAAPPQQYAPAAVPPQPAASQQRFPQQQLVYKGAAARSGTGGAPVAQQGSNARSSGLGSMSEIMAQEQELEQELMQLNSRQARKAAPQAPAAPASSAAGSSHPAASAAARQYDDAGSEARSAGGAAGSADVTAEMLSAALEDPSASVDDIVGILNFVLSQNNINKGIASAGGSAAGLGAPDEQLVYYQQQQEPASFGGRSPTAGAGSNIVRTSQSASEMTARLLQQARFEQGLAGESPAGPTADSQHPSVSQATAAAHGSGHGNSAQQAASYSLSTWQAEGGLLGNRDRSAPAAAADGRSGSSSRHTTPPGARNQPNVVDRLYGPHAERVAAQRTQQGAAWMTPAEIEKVWRQGLRNKSGHGADGQPAGRVHPGVIGPEVQEWLAYDSLMEQQQQQQQGRAVAKPKNTPELDAKLQQLYQRNVDWRKRCEGVYARQRQAEERSELKGCTFVPMINQKSAKIVQKARHGYPARPGSALSAPNAPSDQQHSQFQRSASTGRLNDSRHHRDRHERYVSEEQRIVEESKRAAQESAIRAANAVAAVLGEEAGRQLMEEMLGKDLVQNVTVANDPVPSDGGAAGAGRSDRGETEERQAQEDGNRSSSPHRAWLISDAALRLYVDAFERRERAGVRAKQAAKEAEADSRPRSLPRTATYGDVPPRVYEHLSPEAQTTGPGSPNKALESSTPSECTFKPQTNPRSSKFPSSKRTTPQQSPSATLRSPDSIRNNSTTRKLDAEFSAAVEQMVQQQQELGVGLRQLLSSPRGEPNSSMLSPRTPGSVAAAGRSSGGDSAAATAAAAAAAVAPRSRSAPRSSSGSDDLNWNEFIERQGAFLLLKDAKTAEVAAQMSRIKKPQLSPGSKRILKEKQKASQSVQQSLRSSAGADPYQHLTQYPARLLYGSADATSPPAAAASSSSPAGSSSAGSPYLDRVQQQLQSSQQLSPTSSAQQQREQQQQPEWASYSFKPAITRKAAAKPPRSFEDMSEGDRLRKEAKLEQLRILEEARRLAGVTFSPDMSPTRSRKSLSKSPGELSSSSRPGTADLASNRSPSTGYESVKAKIQLRGPGLEAYMQSLEQKRKDLEHKRKQLEEKRKEAEMAECTFKPTTTPVPAYLAAMQNMGYTARFIESKIAEAAGMSPTQQQQYLQQQVEQQQSPQQAHRARMMQLEQQHRDMLAQQQQIMQQHRAGMAQQQQQQQQHPHRD